MHGGALLGREAGESRGQVAGLEVAVAESVVGRFASRLVQLGGAQRGQRGIVKLGAALAPGAAVHVVAAVDRHAQKPRLQMLVVGEPLSRLQQAHEHGLKHVLSVGDAAHAAGSQAKHGVAPALHGAFERHGVEDVHGSARLASVRFSSVRCSKRTVAPGRSGSQSLATYIHIPSPFRYQHARRSVLSQMLPPSYTRCPQFRGEGGK